MPKADLAWAIRELGPGCARIHNARVYEAYDQGEHNLRFATEKFRSAFGDLLREFAENACPAVVDSLNDRLTITGFRSSEAITTTEEVTDQMVPRQPRPPTTLPTPPRPGGQEGTPNGEEAMQNASAMTPRRVKVTVEDPWGDEAWTIWKRNSMEQVANETHRESLKCGDSFVIAWPNQETGLTELFYNDGYLCAVKYAGGSREVVERGAKAWWDDDVLLWRVNLYYADRIEKYVQRPTGSNGAGMRTFPDKPDAYIPWAEEPILANPYGVVPIVHFPNRKIGRYGVSELRDVIPLQDGLNKAVMDMLVAMEFAAYMQRWITGMEVDIDPITGEPTEGVMKNYGVDRILAISDPEAKVGSFLPSDLGQFLKAQEKFWASIARVSGTPLHYFFITQGDYPSGEAMKAAEARFVKKITDQQAAKGEGWEKVMKMALKMEGKEVPDDLEFEVEWAHASPRSESELADTAVKKKAVGVSRSQLLREFGYDDETITRMLEESDAEQQSDLAKEILKSVRGGRPGEDSAATREAPGTQGVRR